MYIPPQAQTIETRVAVPVAAEYPIDPVNPQTITSADLLALVTVGADESASLAELIIGLDASNTSGISVTFTDGSVFPIEQGVSSVTFGSNTLQPAKLADVTIDVPAGCGIEVNAIFLKQTA